VVVHLGRDRSRVRRLQEIGVVTRRDDGLVEVVTGIHFAPDGAVRPGPAIDALTTLLEP
jgi:hypothetical protein